MSATMATAQSADGERSPHSTLTARADVRSIQPGVPFTVGLRLTLEPTWHTYWINPGDSGLPFDIKWVLPPGFTSGPFRWPAPHLLPFPPLMSYGFEHELDLVAEVTPPASLVPGNTIHIRGSAEWLVCADVCLPAAGDIDVTLPVLTSPAVADPAGARITASVRDRMPESTTGWRLRAWATDSGYALEATPSPGVTLSAPYFFVDTMGVVDHARAQRIRHAGNAYLVSLSKSPFEDRTAKRLRGVIAADTRGDATRAYAVDVPVSDRPNDAIANSFETAAALETGGVNQAPPVSGSPGPTPLSQSLGSVGLAMLFALLGGIILNLMPCVFPVLSVKVVSLIHQSGSNAGAARRQGFAFGAGVLVSFWTLAGILAGLRSVGQNLGWGFQLQSPTVVAVLALLMLALALSMSGVFEFGLSLTRLGGVGSRPGYAGSFLTGLLAVVVASPCTAPFMGSALGYAIGQSPSVTFAVFSSLGVGLAAPYVVLSSSPGLLRYMPRPGAWMETFKQLLAFPLYATVAWLVWVFARQVGVDAAALLLISFVILALAGWTWARAGVESRLATRGVAALLAVAAISAGVSAARSMPTDSSASAAGAWEAFSEQRVSELRAAGRPVFVDFTAAWCLSCQVNERVALASTSVRRAFADHNVALLRADWTSRDSVITRTLGSFGRSGVPLYVLYPRDDSAAPVILPAILTSGGVIAAVIEAASQASR